MKDKTWKQAVQSSATSMDYMDGRQNLRATLEDRGFGLNKSVAAVCAAAKKRHLLLSNQT